MKKIAAIVLAALLLMNFAACGSISSDDGPNVMITPDATPDATSDATPDVTPEATPETTPETTPDAAPEATPEATPEPTPAVDARATAESLVGESVDELYAAIGEPSSSDYAPSCIGDGEDGNLYYDGFVVYTYRENGMETVEYVE